MRKTSLNCVYDLAKADPRVIFIGSDLGAGTLDNFKQEMPERFFMEGIAEQNIIGVAAGLAMEGYIPFVNTIATFLTRRCYEQVAVDLCLQNLPVRLIGNGGGLVYAPLGPTHLAIEDMAIMRAIPNMTVVAPTDADEMKRLMSETLDYPGPIYIRMGKGGDPVVSREEDEFQIGRSICLRSPGEVAIITTGVMASRALQAADLLAEEGIEAGVINMHTVKPLDVGAILALAPKVRAIVTVEEHVAAGGLGSGVIEAIVDNNISPLPVIRRLGIPDSFPANYGSQDSLMEIMGLQPTGIAAAVRELMKNFVG